MEIKSLLSYLEEIIIYSLYLQEELYLQREFLYHGHQISINVSFSHQDLSLKRKTMPAAHVRADQSTVTTGKRNWALFQATLPSMQWGEAFQGKPQSPRMNQLETTALNPHRFYLYSFKVLKISPDKWLNIQSSVESQEIKTIRPARGATKFCQVGGSQGQTHVFRASQHEWTWDYSGLLGVGELWMNADCNIILNHFMHWMQSCKMCAITMVGRDWRDGLEV